jgi:hypothetical protein
MKRALPSLRLSLRSFAPNSAFRPRCAVQCLREINTAVVFRGAATPRSSTFTIHHIVPRSDGGSNDSANVVTICGAHHRAAHRGELVIEPTGDGSARFRHADGSAYGHAAAPQVIVAQAKVFAALRHLGFRERDVKAVLAELLTDDQLREATAKRLLREALCRIRSTR